jgi:hypothetical protein
LFPRMDTQWAMCTGSRASAAVNRRLSCLALRGHSNNGRCSTVDARRWAHTNTP